MVIAVEGVEGAGKSTLVRALALKVRRRGREVEVLREPGGTPLGEEIRRLLLETEYELSAEAELFLFMASRAQLVREKILPALAAGRVVLLDRYLLSSVAYQGGAGGLGTDTVLAMGRLAVKGAEPDLTLLLDIDPKESLGRLETHRFDRIEKRHFGYHRDVRRAYLLAAETYPWPVRVLDAARPPEEVLRDAWSEVDALLGH